MKNNFTKKFYDILFEPVDDEKNVETVNEKEQKYYAKTEVKPIVKKEEPAQVNAKDVLYKKPEQSAFIDYVKIPETKTDMVKPTAKEEGKSGEDETYEFSANISPIFGVIGSKEKEPAPVKTKVISSQTSRPENTHLDFVLSPIYGYSTKEEAEKEHYEVNNQFEEDDEELHLLFETQDNMIIDDEEINLFDAFEDEE